MTASSTSRVSDNSKMIVDRRNIEIQLLYEWRRHGILLFARTFFEAEITGEMRKAQQSCLVLCPLHVVENVIKQCTTWRCLPEDPLHIHARHAGWTVLISYPRLIAWQYCNKLSSFFQFDLQKLLRQKLHPYNLTVITLQSVRLAKELKLFEV